ncbi:MAG: ATPase, T2SS/T4P/T4SS family, partial [Anaerolineales bacterium]
MSLLKRIEQGQAAANPTQPPAQQPGAPPPSNNQQDNASKLAELRMRRTAPPLPGVAPGGNGAVDLKTRVQNKLIGQLDSSMDMSHVGEVRRTIEDLYETILAEEGIVLSRAERKRLFDQIVSEILGLGPLEALLQDDTITEIMVNGPKNIYIERKGKLERVPFAFESNDHVMRIIDRIMAPLGRRIDESHPYEDARLPDGSRV